MNFRIRRDRVGMFDVPPRANGGDDDEREARPVAKASRAADIAGGHSKPRLVEGDDNAVSAEEFGRAMRWSTVFLTMPPGGRASRKPGGRRATIGLDEGHGSNDESRWRRRNRSHLD